MTIQPLAVYLIATFVGFTPKQAEVVTCIAKYESSYNVKALNDTLNSNGSADLGLMQINDKVWGKACSHLDLYNVYDNLTCAKHVFDKQGFTAWVAFKKNKDECLNHTTKKEFRYD